MRKIPKSTTEILVSRYYNKIKVGSLVYSDKEYVGKVMGRSRQNRELIGKISWLSEDERSAKIIFENNVERQFKVVFEKTRENRCVIFISDEQWEEILNLYKSGYSVNKLVRLYKKPAVAIRAFLVKSGVKIKRVVPTYQFNENFFEKIDTEEKAYLLGFLMADGNIYENRMGIIIHKKDVEVLRFFKKSLSSTHPISISKDRARFSIRNHKLVNDLISHGCNPRKSLTLIFPEHLSLDLMPHFIRGYFDGDGWISVSKSKEYQSSTWEYGMISSYIFCDVLQKVMEKFGISLNKRSFGKVAICRIAGNKNDILKKIYHFMYKDATLFLARKREKMEQIIVNREGFVKNKKGFRNAK